MRMRLRWIVLAAAGLLVALPGWAQTVLTVSNWVPPSHPLQKGMLGPWCDDVAKASAGRVKCNLLPKAVASPPGTFDAIRDGLADVSQTVHGYTPGRFFLTQVVEMPFLGDKAEHVAVAYQRIHQRYLENAGEHKGVKVLTVFSHGPGEIYNTRKQIKSLSDLAGMKFRVGGGMVNDVARALGISSLLRPATESYEIISNGIADGLFFPAESIASFKLEKLIRYATRVPGGFYNTSFAMFISETAWSRLSRQDQEAVLSVSGERAARSFGKVWDAADAVGIAAMKSSKIDTLTATPQFVAELKKKIQPIEDNWIKEAKARGWDGGRFLAELRAEVKKVASGK